MKEPINHALLAAEKQLAEALIAIANANATPGGEIRLVSLRLPPRKDGKISLVQCFLLVDDSEAADIAVARLLEPTSEELSKLRGAHSPFQDACESALRRAGLAAGRAIA
jgi:hypothetical protein